MRWSTGRRSDNVVDRRGMAGPIAGGGIGMVVLALVVYMLGGDPSVVTQLAPSEGTGGSQEVAPGAPKDEAGDFVSVVLADTEDTWKAIFRERFQRDYQEPQLVLFSEAVKSGCGIGRSSMGPFYCPRDGRVYIDLAFNRELSERFRAPGDFAQAYVIAHEVGHHVQQLLGISDDIARRSQRADEAGANALSVRQELQADCFAGLWAHHAQRARNVVEPGDIEEALGAASAIGDDKLQQEGQGYVTPETFTHGTSKQRVTWFKRGYESGRVDSCNTMS